MTSPKHLLLAAHWEKVFEELPPEDAKTLLLGCYKTMRGEEPPPYKGKSVGYGAIQALVLEQVRYNAEQFARKCEVQRENANKRWREHRKHTEFEND